MYLKLMSDMPVNAEENLPDSDGRKPYQIIECDQAEFFRDGQLTPFVKVLRDEHCVSIIELTGNAYLMNDKGNTIATASPNKLIPRVTVDVKVTGSIDGLRGTGRTTKLINEAAQKACNDNKVMYFVSKDMNQNIASWKTAKRVIDPASYRNISDNCKFLDFVGDRGKLIFITKDDITGLAPYQLVFDHLQ